MVSWRRKEGEDKKHPSGTLKEEGSMSPEAETNRNVAQDLERYLGAAKSRMQWPLFWHHRDS